MPNNEEKSFKRSGKVVLIVLIVYIDENETSCVIYIFNQEFWNDISNRWITYNGILFQITLKG